MSEQINTEKVNITGKDVQVTIHTRWKAIGIFFSVICAVAAVATIFDVYHKYAGKLDLEPPAAPGVPLPVSPPAQIPMPPAQSGTDALTEKEGAPEVREQVARALFNKGVTLGEQGKAQAAIDTYEEVVTRFGGDTSPGVREQVALARRLLQLLKAN